MADCGSIRRQPLNCGFVLASTSESLGWLAAKPFIDPLPDVPRGTRTMGLDLVAAEDPSRETPFLEVELRFDPWRAPAGAFRGKASRFGRAGLPAAPHDAARYTGAGGADGRGGSGGSWQEFAKRCDSHNGSTVSGPAPGGVSNTRTILRWGTEAIATLSLS